MSAISRPAVARLSLAPARGARNAASQTALCASSALIFVCQLVERLVDVRCCPLLRELRELPRVGVRHAEPLLPVLVLNRDEEHI